MQGMVASTSGRALRQRAAAAPRLAATAAQSRVRCRASSGGASSSFSQRAAELAESAQARVQEFVAEHKLDERAAAATESAKQRLAEAYEETEQSARRAYLRLESEHNISERLDRTRKWAAEAARDIDQQLSVRRRLRDAADDMRRALPVWRRQFSAFSSTQLGKASLTLLFVGLLLSGMLWPLLNTFWLLWWLSVPVSLFLASRGRREQQAAAGTSSPRGGGGPFGDAAGWGRQAAGGGGGGYANSGGPVVEAEWVSLDEGDDGSSGGRRRK